MHGDGGNAGKHADLVNEKRTSQRSMRPRCGGGLSARTQIRIARGRLACMAGGGLTMIFFPALMRYDAEDHLPPQRG
jgi:hypothetical protein